MKALFVFFAACSPASTVTQLAGEALRYALESQQRPICAYPENAEQSGPGVEETKAVWARKCAQ